MITVAADGSSLSNPGPAGWAWYVDEGCWAAGGWPHATNNMAELMAVLDVLRQTATVSDELVILCDSQYVINSVTKWMPGWKKKGWRKADGKPVLNVELLQELDQELAGRKVEFVWVKGHAGHVLNEAADDKARAAATAYRDGNPVECGPGFGSGPATTVEIATAQLETSDRPELLDHHATKTKIDQIRAALNSKDPVSALAQSIMIPEEQPPATIESASEQTNGDKARPRAQSGSSPSECQPSTLVELTSNTFHDRIDRVETSVAPENGDDHSDDFEPADHEMDAEDQTEVLEREFELVRPDVRQNRELFAALLHPDLVAIAPNGRIWTKEEMLTAGGGSTKPEIEILGCCPIDVSTVIVTSQVTAGKTKLVRSSVWVFDRSWLLRLQHNTALPTP